MTGPLDPAAIMADHERRTRYITAGHNLKPGSPTHYCDKCREGWPCLMYRLATLAQEQAAALGRVEANRESLYGGNMIQQAAADYIGAALAGEQS